MMNLSGIDWTDFSWNPITGCAFQCSYCYARKQSRRFCGDVRLNKASDQLKHHGNNEKLWVSEKPFKAIGADGKQKTIPLPVGFEPLFHEYRLADPAKKKLPANIFVGSMCDLFGDWVPDEWIAKVFKACEAAPWHRYMFLTKNPKRYTELVGKGILKEHPNHWYGSTITKPTDEFWYSDNHNTFVSIEPILEPFDFGAPDKKKVDWVIVGAETGNRKGKVIPEKVWISDIAHSCAITGIPLFMKRGAKQADETYFMEKLMGDQFIQEYPVGLQPTVPILPKHRVFVECVRDEKICKHCGKALQGKPATRMGGRYYLCPECLKEATVNEK